ITTLAELRGGLPFALPRGLLRRRFNRRAGNATGRPIPRDRLGHDAAALGEEPSLRLDPPREVFARKRRADRGRGVARARGPALGRADLGPGAAAGNGPEPRFLRLRGPGQGPVGVRAGGVLAPARSQADGESPVATDPVRDWKGPLLGV